MYVVRTTYPPNAFVRAIGFPRQLYFLPCVCFSLCLFYSSGYVSVLIYPVSSFRWVLATRRDYRRISGVFHWDIEQFTCGAQWTEQLNYDETNLRLINQIIEKTLQHRVYQLCPQEDTNFAEWKRLTQVRCFRLKVWRLQVADFFKILVSFGSLNFIVQTGNELGAVEVTWHLLENSYSDQAAITSWTLSGSEDPNRMKCRWRNGFEDPWGAGPPVLNEHTTIIAVMKWPRGSVSINILTYWLNSYQKKILRSLS